MRSSSEVVWGLFLPVLTLAQVRFPGEVAREGLEDELEVRMEERANVAMKACFKYTDPARPESGATGLNLFPLFHKGSEVVPKGGYVTLSGTTPKVMVCAPRSSDMTRETLLAFKTEVDAAFPAKKEKKRTGSDLAEGQLSTVDAKSHLKVLVVTHPFVRLARAYLNLFSVKGDEKLERLKKLSNEANLSFKSFVRFLTRGGSELQGDDRSLLGNWSRNQEWAPLYQTCPICHPDLLPKFVLKTDTPDFEDEFEYLQEVFGLDDLETPVIEAITDVSLKNLYSQIDKSDLDDLCDLYSIDLDMFRYLPDKFYSIVT